MNKQAFLTALGESLRGLPQEDREKSLSFYEEMINDRMEDGASEEEAVAAIGSTEEITAQALSDIPLAKLVKAKVKPSRALKVWEIVLLILGAPVWLPLLFAAVLIVVAVYAVAWAGVITLYAGDLSLAAAGVGFAAATLLYGFSGNVPGICVALGMGLICMGLAIFCFFGVNQVAKWVLLFGRKMLLWLKSLFIRKEEAQ